MSTFFNLCYIIRCNCQRIKGNGWGRRQKIWAQITCIYQLFLTHATWIIIMCRNQRGRGCECELILYHYVLYQPSCPMLYTYTGMWVNTTCIYQPLSKTCVEVHSTSKCGVEASEYMCIEFYIPLPLPLLSQYQLKVVWPPLHHNPQLPLHQDNHQLHWTTIGHTGSAMGTIYTHAGTVMSIIGQ